MINKQTLTIILIIAGILFLPSLFTLYTQTLIPDSYMCIWDNNEWPTSYHTHDFSGICNNIGNSNNDKLDDVDGNFFNINSGDITAYGLEMHFPINETPSTLTQINISATGYASTYGSPAFFGLYIYDFTNSEWDLLGSHTTSNSEVFASLTTGLTDYVSDTTERNNAILITTKSSGPPAGSWTYLDQIYIETAFEEAPEEEEGSNQTITTEGTDQSALNEFKSGTKQVTKETLSFFQKIIEVLHDFVNAIF